MLEEAVLGSLLVGEVDAADRPASQEHVTGDIRMVLHAGTATVNGRRSNHSLYDFNLATYDEGDSFDQSAAKGFVQLHGLSSKISAKRDLGL